MTTIMMITELRTRNLRGRSHYKYGILANVLCLQQLGWNSASLVNRELEFPLDQLNQKLIKSLFK